MDIKAYFGRRNIIIILVSIKNTGLKNAFNDNKTSHNNKKTTFILMYNIFFYIYQVQILKQINKIITT
ncbi:hypothetical protein SAMN05421692_1296 [Chryseobacterium indologenes]|nr:hypothetical protein SAMN05421692_1296 [Chryseobacterium indologenes]SUX49114.1 Uncharacterised protein [Chryseobacterium indologenes]